jgi:hypothetical protein
MIGVWGEQAEGWVVVAAEALELVWDVIVGAAVMMCAEAQFQVLWLC